MLEHRFYFRLSDEDKRILNELSKEFGESKSCVIKRAISFLYSIKIDTDKQKNVVE